MPLPLKDVYTKISSKIVLPPIDKELFSKLFSRKAAEAPALPVSTLSCDFGRAKIVFLEIEKSPQGVKLMKFNKATRTGEPEKDPETLRQAFESGPRHRSGSDLQTGHEILHRHEMRLFRRGRQR